jgi:hypothetical protein
VTSKELQRERTYLSALLLLSGLCCAVVTIGTQTAVQANRLRRAQLRHLIDCVSRPEVRQEGPISELNGMFGSRLLRVTTTQGPAIVFECGAGGGRS